MSGDTYRMDGDNKFPKCLRCNVECTATRAVVSPIGGSIIHFCDRCVRDIILWWIDNEYGRAKR